MYRYVIDVYSCYMVEDEDDLRIHDVACSLRSIVRFELQRFVVLNLNHQRFFFE